MQSTTKLAALALWTVVMLLEAARARHVQLHASPRKSAGAEAKTPWSLVAALMAASELRGFNGTWITDEEFYYTAADKSIHKFNAAKNSDAVLVTSDFLEPYSNANRFTLSPDNTKILVRYNVEQIFRHSIIAQYDVFDIANKAGIQVNGGKKLHDCAWSPIKDRLSFVYDSNVYVRYEDGIEQQLTTDGINGIVYNGIPDWVYEEEVLSSGNAMWWAPDGAKLAVGFFNDTNVKTFTYYMYGEAGDPEYQYPKALELKYPKPGTPNPSVALRIFALNAVDPTPVTITAPTAIVSSDHILQSVVWADADNVLVVWLNRRQNVSTLQLCSVAGECREVVRLTEPDGWITMSTPKCLKSGQHCLFTYWIGDWEQVWKLNLATGKNEWQSRGNFKVLSVYGYDEANDKLYYRANLPGKPYIYHVFSNSDCLTCDLLDADGDSCKSATAAFSKGYSYYTAVCSGPNPTYTKIFATATNTEIKDWENNAAYRQRHASKLMPQVEYLTVPLADGSNGSVKLLLPPDFSPTKKYAMLVDVYGGPNSVRVNSVYSVGFGVYLSTTRDVIYARIDGRGTGDKGKKLIFSVNNNLGVHEVEDQIFVAKYLQKEFPYIDGERVGIWGWSYGGYMAARTLGNDTERVFQCGASVSMVSSWLYYDSIYTERYMGLPTEKDNLAAYQKTSVFENVENFRNHDYLLMHGTADDNVHFQQSMQFAKVLQENDIMFEQMTYPDENHSIGSVLRHVYNTLDNFFANCLNLDVGDESDDSDVQYSSYSVSD